MKRFSLYTASLFLAFLFSLSVCQPLAAQTAVHRMDSVEISLITCSPHEEIYSLYGHTALRCHDLRTGDDMVFNYGIFHPERDFFIWHFIMGHTDYELGVMHTDAFLRYYEQWGSQVTEQVLRLTGGEKLRIIQALQENALPQNRVYRYNIFFDNCSTRSRDIIAANLESPLEFMPREGFAPSFREMVGDCTAGHPWATFGNDILLGVRADLSTTQAEQQFLPVNLRHDIDRATVLRADGRQPLVLERRELVPPGVQMVETGFPLSPFACALLLLALSMAVFFYEHAKKCVARWFDLLLMTATGLAGCILTLMLFSEHPTTSTNLQVLLLNPLPLLFLWHVARGRRTRFFAIQAVLILLFFIGGVWQSYAEGTYIVALCLLMRDARHCLWEVRDEDEEVRGERSRRASKPLTPHPSLLTTFHLALSLMVLAPTGIASAKEPSQTLTAGNDATLRVVVSITIDQLRSDLLEAHRLEYGTGGFQLLTSKGTVYGSASYPFAPVDRASAIAAVMSGTVPYYNGIVGQRWLNRQTLRPMLCIDDNRYPGLQTTATVSPEALSTSTLGDELKVATDGKAKVWAIASSSDAAILAAGHAADGALWRDDTKGGGWCSSQYYMSALPTWVRTADEGASVTDMALRCLRATAMGSDFACDLLCVTYDIDSYPALDRELARLIAGVERQVGETGVLFVVTSTGYCEEREEGDYAKYRIPTGTFYMSRTADLLNMYLGALWGQGKYVETTFRNHIFLNHDLLDKKKISISEATSRAQELLVMMEGVRNVYTSLQLLTISNEQIQRVRMGYHPERCGDLVIETAPGWRVLTENTGDSEHQRASFVQFPIIFYGAGITPQRIGQPVTTDRIAPTIARRMRIRAPNACSAEPLF